MTRALHIPASQIYFKCYLRARCGRARFNLEIRHFTQTGTFGLDALLPVPDVSGAARTLVAAGLVGALGAGIEIIGLQYFNRQIKYYNFCVL